MLRSQSSEIFGRKIEKMSKVNFCVVICLFVLPSLTVANVLRDSYVTALRNNRRISREFQVFFSDNGQEIFT